MREELVGQSVFKVGVRVLHIIFRDDSSCGYVEAMHCSFMNVNTVNCAVMWDPVVTLLR